MKVTKCSKTQLPFQALTYLKKAHDNTPNQKASLLGQLSGVEYYVFWENDKSGGVI